MRTLRLGLILTIAATMTIAPMALTQGLVPNPVVNADFELRLPSEPTDPLRGSALDACVGVGHQVFYGSHTPQGAAENATVHLVAPEDRQAEG